MFSINTIGCSNFKLHLILYFVSKILNVKVFCNQTSKKFFYLKPKKKIMSTYSKSINKYTLPTAFYTFKIYSLSIHFKLIETHCYRLGFITSKFLLSQKYTKLLHYPIRSSQNIWRRKCLFR